MMTEIPYKRQKVRPVETMKWSCSRRRFVILTLLVGLVVISLFVFENGLLSKRLSTSLIQRTNLIKGPTFTNPRNSSYVHQGNVATNNSISKNNTYSTSKSQRNTTRANSSLKSSKIPSSKTQTKWLSTPKPSKISNSKTLTNATKLPSSPKPSKISTSRNRANSTKWLSTPIPSKTSISINQTNVSKTTGQKKKENEKRRRKENFIQTTKHNAMSKDETSLLMKTLVEFDKLWRQKLGHHYHINAGSLLGAYRHSGIIPYDDDMDILVPIRFAGTFESYLNGSELKATKWGPRMRKMYLRNDDRTKNFAGFEWRWPHIDVMFEVNDISMGHVEDLDFPSYYFKVGDVYPTILMDLGGHEFPAPRCVHKVLTKLYGKDFMTKCCTHGFSHRRDRSGPSACCPCEDLKDLYEFTSWKRTDNEYAERRVFKNFTLVSKQSRIYLPKCS